MKKIIFGVLFLSVVFIATQSAMGGSLLKSAKFATDTKLQVFGQTVETDIVSAQKAGVNGTTNYVSARDLALYLGYDVKWDGKNKIISVGLFPQNGIQVDAKDIESVKPQIDETKNNLLSKFSTRELDSFSKELAYYQQIFEGDPAVLSLVLVEDYKGYKEGKESQFDYMWKELDK